MKFKKIDFKQLISKLKKLNLKKVPKSNLTIGLVCFLIAFMITAQVRTISVSGADILRLKKENELRDEVNQWKDAYETATNKITELNTKISDYQKSASKENDTAALLKFELDNANIIAGFKDLRGPGIVVTLDDTRALDQLVLEAGIYDPNMYIIHDTDLVMTVNELFSAGAEAISINGQRIIASTSIRCTGPQVLINGIRMVAPFTITAIGEPKSLQASLGLRGGIVTSMKASDIDVTIEPKEEVVVPAYAKAIVFQYAKTLEEGAGE